LITRDTVLKDTPASLATSTMVGLDLILWLSDSFIGPGSLGVCDVVAEGLSGIGRSFGLATN